MKKSITIITLMSLLMFTACNNSVAPSGKTKNSTTGLEYQDKNYGEKMNWRDAKKYCQAKGNGWRLPTFNELEKLTEKKGLTNFPKSDNIFWVSNEDKSMPEGDYHFTISSTGERGTNEGFIPHSVLCVK